MAGERIAHGEVFIEVNDRDALARLNEIRREYHNTMQAIDRDEANPEIKADMADFKDAVANAKRELKRLEGEKAEVDLGIREGSLKEYNAQIKKAKANIRSLDGMKAEMEIEVHGADNAIKEQQRVQKATEARIKAEEKQEREMARLADKLHRDNMARVNQDSRVRESLNKQRLRELSTAEREARQMEKERNEVPKLEAAYARLQTKLEGLSRARRKARGDDHATFMVDVSTRETLSELERLRGEVRRRVGRDPISMPVTLSFGERAGNKIRSEFYRNNGHLIPLAAGLGADMGSKMGDSTVRRFRQITERGIGRSLGDAVKAAGTSAGRSGLGVLSKFGHALGNLSDATVRLGPFTSSIRGAGLALSVLGPVIVDLVGALGSLVSVAGAATLGVGALGLGASGLLLSLGGVAMLIKPMLGDFKTLTQLGTAYHTSVLKYGAGSKQAAQAQKQLNEALKGADAGTRAAYMGMDKLRTTWGKYVDEARPEFIHTLGDAFKTANADVNVFGRNSVQAVKAVGQGLRGWMKGLRSSEGKGIIDSLMGNANKSIGPLMHGLGNIVTYLGRVAQIASGAIPGLAREFDRWSESIKATSEDSASLSERVHGVIQNAKDVGRFFLAAGRFVKAFFAGGVDAGDSFVNTMTNALDRWTAFLNTTQGQSSLKSFFSQSVAGAEALWSALEPIITGFVRWAIEIAPIARAFFSGASAVTNFANSLLRVTALRGPVTAIATTLGTLWAVGRISAATRAITGFGAALMGIQRAEAAGTAMGEGGMLAGMLGGSKGASKAAGEVSLLRRAAVLAVPAIGEMGTVAAGAWTGGLALLAAGAIYGSYKLLTAKSASDKFRDSVSKSIRPINDLVKANIQGAQATVQVGTAQHDYALAVAHVSAYKAKLNRLEREGKKDTAEYKSTLAALNQALYDRTDADNKRVAAQKQVQDANQKEINANKDLQKTSDNLAKAQKEQSKWAKEVEKTGNPEAKQRLRDATKDLAVAQDAYNQKLLAQRAAAMQAAINAINYQRAVKGLIPAAGAAANALAKLYRRNSTVAAKIAVKYEDPKDAGRVAAKANSALKAGVSSKIVTKIVADSSSADQAMRRLQGQARALEARRFSVKLGADDKASSTIAKIVARVNSMPEGKAKLRAIDNATGTIAKIISRITHIPNKDARLVARDLISGKAGAALKAIARIPNSKNIRLAADVSNAIAQLNLMRSGLSAIKSKSIVVSATKMGNGWDARAPGAGHASGRGPTGHERAWVGEGHNWKGAPEYIADHRTGAVSRVNGPVQMDLNPYQAVIPTEQRYRGVGQRLWSDFAERFGMDTKLPRFAKSRKPKNPHLSDKGKLKARGQARATIKSKAKARTYNSDNLVELATVETRQRAENNLRDQVQREATILDGQEPATFIKVVGTDADGNDLYDVDQAAISAWSAKLEAQAKRFDQLVAAIFSTLSAVEAAMKRIGDPYAKNNPVASVIGHAQHNLSTLDQLASGERSNVAHAKSKASKDAAKERLRVYLGAMTDEHGTISAATSDWKQLDTEKNDIGDKSRGRLAEAYDSADTYRADSAAVAGKAAADAASSNPQAKTPDAPTAPPTPLELAQQGVSALDSQSALAAIGMAVAPSSQSIIDANKGVITAAQAMLTDSDPSNDSDAYSAISSAAGNIQGVNDASATSAAAGNQQYMTNSNSRFDLFSGMGNNFTMASSLGTLGSSMRSAFGGGGYGSGAYGVNAAAGGPTNVVVNNTFPTPPADPHTWSKGIAFELQAAL